MTQSFPRATGLSKGYAVEQVDEFLSRAARGAVSAEQVRTAGFDLVRGGYEVEAVDRALDGLEDDLASRERDAARDRLGHQGLWDRASAQAQVLRARVNRPHGDRFPRGTSLHPSYDVSDVDELCNRIADFFDGSGTMRPEDVRTAVFRTRRGRRGYREDSVDRYLDRVVDIMVQVS